MDRLETGYLIKIAKQVYNNQTAFPRYPCLGLSYIDGNGKKAYFTSRPLIMFISSILTNEGFTSLVPTLKFFKALH